MSGHKVGTEGHTLDGSMHTEVLRSATETFSLLGSERFRAGKWIFRGQSNASWPLQPSLQRFSRLIHDLPSVIENHAAREFRRRAHHFADSLPDSGDLLEWLALMRHHGSPTRLLDFTKSPYVAAFFAVEGADRDADAAIWAIDALALKHHAAQVLSNESLSVWVRQVGAKCLAGGSFSDPVIFNQITSGNGPIPEAVVPVEPFRFNQRIVLQQGLFLCPVSISQGVSFEASLANVFNEARSSQQLKEPATYKLVIEPSAHPHILRELHRMNVNHATLFPGLDGLALSLANVSRIRATSVSSRLRPDWEFDPSF